jgi:hypothetical protein
MMDNLPSLLSSNDVLISDKDNEKLNVQKCSSLHKRFERSRLRVGGFETAREREPEP